MRALANGPIYPPCIERRWIKEANHQILEIFIRRITNAPHQRLLRHRISVLNAIYQKFNCARSSDPGNFIEDGVNGRFFKLTRFPNQISQAGTRPIQPHVTKGGGSKLH